MKKPKLELKKQVSIRIKKSIYLKIKSDHRTIQNWIDKSVIAYIDSKVQNEENLSTANRHPN